jgi:hypothetical protein
MNTRKKILFILGASAILLGTAIGLRISRTAHASPSAGEPSLPGQVIPYMGQLLDGSGQPVADGAYNFIFELYVNETGGDMLWQETKESVAVQGGSFSVMLGSLNMLPEEILESGNGWLAVSVQGEGESVFTPLNPRQQLNMASPESIANSSAGLTCAHDHWGEAWSGTGGNKGLYVSSQGGYALEGWSTGNVGVVGVSTSGAIVIPSGMTGVYGIGDNYGMVGYGNHGAYFSGYDDHQDLILGGAVGRINTDPNDQNSQLYLSSNADTIIKLDNDSGENNFLRIKNSSGADVCTVSEDPTVGLVCTVKSAIVTTPDYGQRRLYSVESPEVWFEDFGEATLVNGEVTVPFDPIFAETVNLEEDYHVFLTPLCQEPVLLSVTNKGTTGFTVRGVTLDNQLSQCSFDYRITAKRLGYENVRLEETNWQEGAP